jgi:hypothetical protein
MPDYQNPDRLAGLMRAFDLALGGKGSGLYNKGATCENRKRRTGSSAVE